MCEQLAIWSPLAVFITFPPFYGDIIILTLCTILKVDNLVISLGFLSTGIFPDHLQAFQTIRQISRPSGNFPDHPETFQCSFKGCAKTFRTRKNFPDGNATLPSRFLGRWQRDSIWRRKKLSPLTWKSAQIGKKRFHFFGRKWRVKDWMHRCRIKTYEMHLPPPSTSPLSKSEI